MEMTTTFKFKSYLNKEAIIKLLDLPKGSDWDVWKFPTVEGCSYGKDTWFLTIKMETPDMETVLDILYSIEKIESKKPVEHSFRTEAMKDGYKLIFETTSRDEYMDIESTFRRIIDNSKMIPFHCACGCDFERAKGSVVIYPFPEGDRYITECPDCDAICKTPVEET